jgi:hypothetical protein
MGRRLSRRGEQLNSSSDDPIKTIPSASPDGSTEASKSSRKPVQRAPITPTLTNYFGPKPISAAAFINAVRTERLSRFSEDDISRADKLIAANDPDCRRLCALVSKSNLPDAIERWIWLAVQDRLKLAFAGEFSPAEADAETTLRYLLQNLAPRLESADTIERSHSEILLSLGLSWLVAHRALNPWTALERLASAFYKDRSAALRTARRLLAHGEVREIRAASAVAGVAHETVRVSRAEQEMHQRKQVLLQSQLDEARVEIAGLRSQLATVHEERAELTAKLEREKKLLDESRQHWGHDMVDIKARQNNLLRERLKPLLNDAVDALQIQPPAPDIALERVMIALSSIEEAAR